MRISTTPVLVSREPLSQHSTDAIPQKAPSNIWESVKQIAGEVKQPSKSVRVIRALGEDGRTRNAVPGKPLTVQTKHGRWTDNVAPGFVARTGGDLSPDKARIAYVGGGAVKGDTKIRILDARTGALQTQFSLARPGFRTPTTPELYFSPDGTKIGFLGTRDQTTAWEAWDVASGTFIGERPVDFLDVSPDGARAVGRKWLDEGFDDLFVFDPFDFSRPMVALSKSDRVVLSTFVFGVNDTIVGTSTDHSSLHFWNGKTGATQAPWRYNSSQTERLGFSAPFAHPFEPVVITTHAGERAAVWNTQTGEPVREFAFNRFSGAVKGFSPEGLLVVQSKVSPASAQLWDPKTGTLVGHALIGDAKQNAISVRVSQLLGSLL